MSTETGKYRLFCVCPKAAAPRPRWFFGKQTHPLGLTRWGGVVYAFGYALALGLEYNDGPFWQVTVLPPRFQRKETP